jgi:hypothetical protein
MQRRATKNTRGPNANEKRFMAYTKECACICCGNPGPSIVHHCEGATFKHNKVLVGHWFVIPLCQTCDDVVTHGSKNAFRDINGSQAGLWFIHYENSLYACLPPAPDAVLLAISDWNK